MEKIKNYKLLIYIILVLAVAVGIYLYFTNTESKKTEVEQSSNQVVNNEIEQSSNQIVNNEAEQNSSQVSSENEKEGNSTTQETNPNRTVPISNGDKKLEEQVKEDEEKYGDDYQEFKYCQNTYKRKPDRIYFKNSSQTGFYQFENNDVNFLHLVQVVEDRMAYTAMEDYNLWAFTPDSISTIMSSNKNYVIFDYDNKDASELDTNYNKDIIFTFNENTRLYRLLCYLSSNKELIKRENLPKSEFADNTVLSGYKYMMYDIMD